MRVALLVVAAAVLATSVSASAAKGPVGTRKHPVPLGKSAAVGGWRVAVVAVSTAKEPQRNVVASVRATYVGPGKSYLHAVFRFRALGGSGIQYTMFDHGCGAFPNPITDEAVSHGQTVEGNLCWAVRTEDASGLLMFSERLRSSGKRVWFRLS
jgi:hypothetical protein